MPPAGPRPIGLVTVCFQTSASPEAPRPWTPGTNPLYLSKDTDRLCQCVWDPFSPKTAASSLLAVATVGDPAYKPSGCLPVPVVLQARGREQPSCVKIKHLKPSSCLHRGARLCGFEGEGGSPAECSQLWMLLGAEAVQETPMPVSAVCLDNLLAWAVHGPSLYLSAGEAGASEGSA